MTQRRRLVEPRKPLSVRHQCRLLGVPRSRLYYRNRPEKPENKRIMDLLTPHLDRHRTEGVRSAVHWLADEKDIRVGPKRVRRILRLMGHQALIPRRRRKPDDAEQPVQPYLLRNLSIVRPNQVWSTDITYIPMGRGFLYLTAFMDVYSRKIVSWGISNSLDARWCVRVLQDAISRHGSPQIINSDQGSQYRSTLWLHATRAAGIQLSMVGKGRATDNRWIERFWGSVKRNSIRIDPPQNGHELYDQLEYFIRYYNGRRNQGTDRIPDRMFEDALDQLEL